MKYSDSIVQAKTKMSLAIQQLDKWHVPADPINYTVAYHYCAASHQALNSDIDDYIETQHSIDVFFLQEIYQEYLVGGSQIRSNLVTDIDSFLSNIHNQCETSSGSVSTFLQHINEHIPLLKSNNTPDVTGAISAIYKASTQLKQQQEVIAASLIETQNQTAVLQAELDAIRKEAILDPLTGLYNKTGLNQYVETWLMDDPERELAAIVINIDHFRQLGLKFGPLISNVLLSKVANKVKSYVGESGFPARTAGDEFLILLPDIEQSVANEIAEKIRQGVEKLTFVSNKSGIRLPKMTISLSVNKFEVKNNIKGLLAKTRIAMKQFQQHAHNQVLA